MRIKNRQFINQNQTTDKNYPNLHKYSEQTIGVF